MTGFRLFGRGCLATERNFRACLLVAAMARTQHEKENASRQLGATQQTISDKQHVPCKCPMSNRAGAISLFTLSSSSSTSTTMLKTMQDMWVRLMLLTGAVNTTLFFACGIYATLTHVTGPKPTRSPRWTLALLFAPILGALNAFILGAVPSFLIAAVYVNINATMSEASALGWGCGQGLFIALVNAGSFQCIV
eukprot:IDg20224t1